MLSVFDLATRLGWSPTDATPLNPVIVIEDEGQMRGLIAHEVADIVSIEASTHQHPDAIDLEDIANFLRGIAPLVDEMVMGSRPGSADGRRSVCVKTRHCCVADVENTI